MYLVYDAIVRQQLFIEQIKNGKQAELNLLFVQVSNDLRQVLALEDFSNMGELNKKALRELVQKMREALRGRLDLFMENNLTWLYSFMQEDALNFKSVYEPVADPDKVAEQPEDDDGALLWAFITGGVMAATGVNPLVYLKRFSTSVQTRITDFITGSHANRLTKEAFIAELFGTKTAQHRDGLMNRLFQAGNAVNDTVIQHFDTQTNAGVARGLFGLYEWVSVLDGVTTRICRSRDGRQYRYGQGPVPPAHIRCRSSIIPVIAGQDVPQETFAKWANRQPEGVIEEIFGQKKAPEDFKTTRVLTIQGLKDKRKLLTT